jgi:hypothetical protein
MHVSKKEDRPGNCRGGECDVGGQPGRGKKIRTGFSQKWRRCGKKITQNAGQTCALECRTKMTRR